MGSASKHSPPATSIERSLTDTIINSSLADMLADYAEIRLDELLTNDILREVPIFKTILAVGRIYGRVSDYFFIKKVLGFLAGLKDVAPAKREAALAELSDKKQQRKWGEKILLLLDRMNDFEKPSLLARAFRALLEGRIDYVSFLRLSSAIDALDMTYVSALKALYSGSAVEPEEEHHFFLCGLMAIRPETIGTFFIPPSPSVSQLERNALGELFVREVLDEPVGD